jgi:formylglycine-generating enzyme required for sulfatase activity
MYKIFTALIFLFVFGNATAQPAAGVSALDWAKKKCTDLGFKAGTERFGNCVLQLSRNDVAVSANPKNTSVGAQQTVPAGPKFFKDCDECPEMVVIPGGKFLMGSKDDPFADPKPNSNEFPQRELSVNSFSIGRYEVTQEQWYFVTGELPSYSKGRMLPVENITLEQAEDFALKLSRKTGKNYRLPTESEWEYAAKSGKDFIYPDGIGADSLEEYSWFKSNSNGKPQPVGQKKANSFGLFDISGNVSEWVACGEAACKNYIAKGGSFLDSANDLRTAAKFQITNLKSFANAVQPFYFRYHIGIRVARDN